MAQTMSMSALQFVDWSQISGPNKDPATRLLIRKQAMNKAAVARRQRNSWAKKNRDNSTLETTELLSKDENNGRKQGKHRPPAQDAPISQSSNVTFCLDGVPVEDVFAGSVVEPPSANDLERPATIPPNMPSVGYEMMRIQCKFDLLDLSAMTTFHVGRITSRTLVENPQRLVDVLQCRQFSYFTYLPSRWGHFACLDDAARCVANRVQRWISGEVDPHPETLALYSRALSSLQKALNDPILCLEPEVLCATEILSIHELLDDSNHQAWAHHAAGARQLVKLRGPHRFQSKFERALFLAQIGPINTEALIENQASFLEGEAWSKVFESMLAEQIYGESMLADCGVVVISLWSSVSAVPTVKKDVQDLVMSGAFPSDTLLENLTDRIRALDAKITQWRSRYEHLLLNHIADQVHPSPFFTPSSSSSRSDKPFETLAVCFAMCIILRRIAIALDPLGAVYLEDEAQDFARRIADLERQAVRANPRAALFMAFKMEISHATLQTTDEWRVSSALDVRVGANGLITPHVFKRWCDLKSGNACENEGERASNALD